MRVTIQKTMYLEEMPEEIDENSSLIEDRIMGIKQLILEAKDCSMSGRYVDCCEKLEKVRLAMAILDKNIEEQQSMCVSYESLRIQKQMPQQQHPSPDLDLEGIPDE